MTTFIHAAWASLVIGCICYAQGSMTGAVFCLISFALSILYMLDHSGPNITGGGHPDKAAQR